MFEVRESTWPLLAVERECVMPAVVEPEVAVEALA